MKITRRLLPALLCTFAATATSAGGSAARRDADIPELHGATSVVRFDGVPRRVLFKTATPESLEAAAWALLRALDGHRDSRLTVDPSRAMAFGARDARFVSVLQHRVGETEVVDSIIVVKLHKDGRGEITNGLIPVAVDSTPVLEREGARRKARKALGSEPVGEPVGEYRQSGDGKARLHYRIDVAPSRVAVVDAATGAVRLASRAVSMRFDSAPDDGQWTNPPIQWTGENLADPAELVTCDGPFWPRDTSLYFDPHWLNAAYGSVNVEGPAWRMRDPVLGLTSIRWEDSAAALHSFLFGNTPWDEISARIYKSSNHCLPGNDNTFFWVSKPNDPLNWNPAFDAPAGFAQDVPYSRANFEQYQALQTAMEDIEDRFGWKGVDSANDRLIFAQDVEPAGIGCAWTKQSLDPLHAIHCERDEGAISAGQPERPVPVDVLAHEYAHSILWSHGLRNLDSAPHAAVAEALADMFGIWERFLHHAEVWQFGGEPGFQAREKERLCQYSKSEYCAAPARVATRDLQNPKTMNPIDPSPKFRNGQFYAGSDPGRQSQVTSHMLYLMSEGAPAGFLDDDPGRGSHEAFRGIGLQRTMELFFASLKLLPSVNADMDPERQYAFTMEAIADEMCGLFAEESKVARRAGYVTGLLLDDADFSQTGFVYPKAGQSGVPPLVAIEFDALPGELYQYQIATDAAFTTLAFSGLVKGKFQATNIVKKLAPATTYWVRVRPLSAPMLASVHIDKNSACWSLPLEFTTGPAAQVTGATPAQADTVSEPWRTTFRWAGNTQWRGYEFWVYSNEEPPSGLYWAHRVLKVEDLAIDPEDPGDPGQPKYALTLPMPKSEDLCWAVVPFGLDENANRIDGDPSVQCFQTGDPSTLITSPTPPGQDGQLTTAPAQPLAITFDPADGSAKHALSLELLELAGQGAPEAKDQWAYIDHFTAKPEDYAAKEWTTRTRERMLPVQKDAGPYLSYSLKKVRVSIQSTSPVIPAPDSGGTYEPRTETTGTHAVDFQPGVDGSLDFTPHIVTPVSANRCSSIENKELMLSWQPGPDATPQRIAGYRMQLYPQHCGNLPLVPCTPAGDPDSPEFVKSRVLDRQVPNEGAVVHSEKLDADSLFTGPPDDGVTGFLVHLFGVSGPEPGPAGLNITGLSLADLPVPAAKVLTEVVFEPGPAGSPELAGFAAWASASKSPSAPPVGGVYAAPYNHILVNVYEGEGCREDKLLFSNANQPLESYAAALVGDIPALEDDAEPVVSARSVLLWKDRLYCPDVESTCVSVKGTNPYSRPAPVAGVGGVEHDGVLDIAWDAPADPNPGAIEYHVAVTAGGNQPQNLLVDHPGPVVRPYAQTDAIDGRIGIAPMAGIDASDLGKWLVLSVKACRKIPNKADLCSSDTQVQYQVGSGASQDETPPGPPQDVALHYDDPVAQQTWQALMGFDPGPQSHWIMASWNAPAGKLPAYYLVKFDPSKAVPGRLPNWLNTLGVPGLANYVANPEQYVAVVRGAPGGLVIGSNSQWGRYVWPVAETSMAGAPEDGQWMDLTVWACAGTAPIDPARSYDWITDAGFGTCSPPVEVQQPYP